MIKILFDGGMVMFHGGVVLPKNKKLNKSPICYNFIPKKVSIDCLGGNATVAVDSFVTAGEIIAEGGVAPVYSSVCGRVVSVDMGRVEIEVNGDINEFKRLPLFELGISTDNREEMLKYLSSSGIVYKGKELSSLLRERISGNTVRMIVNCIETRPESACRFRTVTETAEEVIGGAKILLSILGIRTAVIVLEKGKKELAAKLEKVRYDKEMFIISMLPHVYPAEFKEIIANEVFYDGSVDKIFDVDPMLCVAVYDAFVHGVSYIGKNITVGRENCYANLFVPFGSSYKELDRFMNDLFSSPFDYDSRRAVKNSLIYGEHVDISDGDCYFDGNCDSIYLYLSDDAKTRRENYCVDCGNCSRVCPMELEPSLIYREIKKSGTAFLDFDKCILCGCCSYVCPSFIPHIDLFKKTKRGGNNNA